MRIFAAVIAALTLVVVKPAFAEKNITDLHCHTAGIGAGDSGNFVNARLRDSYKFKFYLSAFGVTLAELQQHGDRLVVERIAARLQASGDISQAVILALDGAVDAQGELDRDATELYIDNDFVAREVKAFSNLLYGASINPLRRDAGARLQRAAADGAVLVKWLPALQHFDPADPRIIPFYDALKKLNMPLLTHTGDEHSFTTAENRYCDPQRLELALQRGVRVIAAHAASDGASEGEPNLERLARLMAHYENLYVDISALTQVNRRGDLQRVLKDPRFKDRLAYGSDFPLITIPLLTTAYVQWNDLSFGDMRTISGLENPWDRDVELKRALHTPEAVFARSRTLLRLPATK